MRINAKNRTLTLKAVYYGPGMSGKTTNLRSIHRRLPANAKGELIQLATEDERTLFFDYCPIWLGRLGDYRLRVHLFSVPGQSFYASTRAAVLKGADGIVFVADSRREREAANLQALADLERQLNAAGLEDIPVVFQWNKQDLPEALPPRMLEASLNPDGLPSCEASALRGDGVDLTQAMIMRAMLKRQQSQLGLREEGGKAG
ncbi:MAG: GTPase domain-containing protein [Alphaproteobacteria bacterium]|nr:GTPase domain-containing protein [Alphaproteobacteria bacterium]